jgi:SNF2 family DNA or RNA helicase
MTAPPIVPVQLKVTAAHGRLYVAGPSCALAKRIVGAAYNERRHAYEISWTLESLRALRRATGLSYAEFSRFCTPEVLAWAERAHASHLAVTEAAEKVSSGWRPTDLEWQDNRAGTLAPEGAKLEWTEPANDPQHPELRVWKYREPYDKQEIMAAMGILLDGSANLSQMGTGKTRAMCEIIAHQLRTGEIDVAVVVCPKNMLGTWYREAPVWSDQLRPHILGFRLDRKTGDTIAKRQAWLEDFRVSKMVENDPGYPNLIIVNYEAVAKLEASLLALSGALKVGLYPDEMHRLSNPQAQVTKTFLKLAPKAVRRLGMTGTPVKDRTGEGVWSQWYFVDLGVTFGANYAQYNREWMDENPWTHDKTPKPGALEAIGQRMAMRSVRFLKTDCMNLPPKTYLPPIEVELTDEQWKAYDEMKDDLLTEFGEHDPDTSIATAATQLSAITRLAQITSGFVPVEKSALDTDGFPISEKALHRFTPNPKLEALKDLIDSEIDQQQIIVWAYFRPDHDLLMRELAAYHPLLLRGGMSPMEHDQIEQAFQSGQHRLLIAQQQAGGEGRNFQACSLAVYYSQRYSLTQREQSEDRSHRGGSEIHAKISYVDLIAKGTIDEEISAALAEKKTVAEVVVDLRRKLRGW